MDSNSLSNSNQHTPLQVQPFVFTGVAAASSYQTPNLVQIAQTPTQQQQQPQYAYYTYNQVPTMQPQPQQIYFSDASHGQYMFG